MSFLHKLLAVFALSITLLSSCSKNELIENTPSNPKTTADLSTIDRGYINDIKHFSNEDARLALETLSPEEKYLLWQDHIDGYLAQPNLSPDLRTHILKLKSFVTVDLYRTLGTPETEIKNAKFLYEWYTKPISEGRFTKKELLQIGTAHGLGTQPTIEGTPVKTSTVSSPSAVAELPKCDCSYDLGCTTGDCRRKSCMRATTCGITGTSACSGLCG